MGAFKTGVELQEEQLRTLAASNMKLAGGSSPQEQRNRQIGSLLGTALVGQFQGDPGQASGDILAGMDKPPETAAEWAEVQKQLFAAGLEEEGLGLTSKIKGLQETEKGFADATPKVSKPITSDDDRQFVVDNITARASNEESLIGTILAPMMAEDATPGQKGQAAVFRSAVAEQASTIHQQLIDKGIEGITKSMVTQSILDNVETSKDILSPETGFLWFGEDAGVNTKELNRFLGGVGTNMVKGIETQMKGSNKPVTPAPAQATTRAPAEKDPRTGLPVTAQAFDIQGRVEGAGQGSPLGEKLLTKEDKKAAVDATTAQLKEVTNELTKFTGTINWVQKQKKDKLMSRKKALIQSIKDLHKKKS